MSDAKQKWVADYAQVELLGRLGGDPVIRETRSGTSLANVSLAVGQRVKNPAGEWEDGDPMWFKVTSFDDLLAGFAKGDRVKASGRLSVQRWESKTGEIVTSFAVALQKGGMTLYSKPKAKQEAEVAEVDEYPAE